MDEQRYVVLHPDLEPAFIKVGGVPIKAWVQGVHFEEGAQLQLKNIASLPFIFRHVAAMPDVHLPSAEGSGCASHAEARRDAWSELDRLRRIPKVGRPSSSVSTG